MGDRRRYFFIVVLACQQYLAIALIYAAVPVILRAHGAGLELVGLFSTVFFAFTINFLWAPVVDRYSLGPLGLRWSWILATQIASAIAVGGLAILDPAADFVPVFVVSVALATLAATQRIATLGYVAEALGSTERPFGAALVGWGAAVGNVIGGAACLQLIDAVGWKPALLGFALLLAAFAIGIGAIPEPAIPRARVAAASLSASLPRLLRNGRLWAALFRISPAVFGVAVAFAMVSPRLVDLGFAASDIGLIAGLANVAAFSLVGPLTSAVVSRTTPRRGVTLVCAVLAIGFVLLMVGTGAAGSANTAIAAVGLVFGALAAQHVAFTSWFLALARPGEAATDVTFLASGMSALALAGFAASGFIATAFGYDMTLALAGGGYALTAILLALPSASRADVGPDVLESGPVR